MKINYIKIKNYKSIEELEITDIEDVLILVGRNNAGKSVVLDAIRAVSGDYVISGNDFNNSEGNIVISMKLAIDDNDLRYMCDKGTVSNFKHYDLWIKDFKTKLPSYKDGELVFDFVYSRDGVVRYRDGVHKNNSYIKAVVPKIYFVDHYRDKSSIQEDLIMLQGKGDYAKLKNNDCIFEKNKPCNQCFNCIGMINKKKPEQLSLVETARLMQYKLFDINLAQFEDKLNENFERNGGKGEQIHYEINFDVEELMKINTVVYNKTRNTEGELSSLSEGLNSIYILSLLETYASTATEGSE